MSRGYPGLIAPGRSAFDIPCLEPTVSSRSGAASFHRLGCIFDATFQYVQSRVKVLLGYDQWRDEPEPGPPTANCHDPAFEQKEGNVVTEVLGRFLGAAVPHELHGLHQA